MNAPSRRLTRRTDRKLVAGVLSGLADYLGTTPLVVRLVFLASCILPGPQFLLYIVAWIVVPARQY